MQPLALAAGAAPSMRRAAAQAMSGDFMIDVSECGVDVVSASQRAQVGPGSTARHSAKRAPMCARDVVARRDAYSNSRIQRRTQPEVAPDDRGIARPGKYGILL